MPARHSASRDKSQCRQQNHQGQVQARNKSLARGSIISIHSSGGKPKLKLAKTVSRPTHKQTEQRSRPSRVQPKNRQPRLRLAQLNPRLLINHHTRQSPDKTLDLVDETRWKVSANNKLAVSAKKPVGLSDETYFIHLGF